MSLNREQPMRPFLDTLADAFEALKAAFEAYVVPAGSIDTNELADGAVTNAKIANGAVNMDKLASDVQIPQPTDAQVTSAVNAALAAHPEWTTTVQDGSITGVKVANDTIPDAKLVQTGGVLEQSALMGDEMPNVNLAAVGTPSEWALTGTGLCTPDSSSKMMKYAVAGGDVLYVNLSKDNAGVYQWQNDASVPASGTNSSLIGEPVKTATRGLLEVPAGATYLIVSQLQSNTTNYVKSVSAATDLRDIDATTLAEKTKMYLARDMQQKYYNGSSIIDAPLYYSMISCRTLPFDIQVDFSGKQFKAAIYSGDNESALHTISSWGTAAVWIPANSYFMLSAQDSAVHTLADWYGFFNVSVESDIDRRNSFAVPEKAYGSYYNVPSRFQLLWFSDIHAVQDNLRRIMQYANSHAVDLNDVICTGDMVFDQYTDDYTYWHTLGADNVLTVAGNHEGAKGNNQWATQQELYDKYFAPYIANWGVTYDAGYANWYKVYNSKVMLIGLTPYTTTTAEENELNTFLTDALNLAKTNGYAVVIAHHYPANPSVTTSLDTPFNTPNRTPTTMFIQDSVISVVSTFVQDGGEFVCFITGHTHYDRAVKLTSNNLLVLTVGTAATPQGIQDNSQYRSLLDTRYYDLFNILHVDTAAKVVSIKRIGTDRDVWFRKLDYLAVNYETHEII